MLRLTLISVLSVALACVCPPAGSVHVSSDDFGQVVIFPYAVASESLGRQTLIELRNGDPQRHLIVSFQVKHLGGRPLLSGNVVIGPNGSYASALIQGEAGVSVTGVAAGQCATAELSQPQNPVSYQFIDGPVTLAATLARAFDRAGEPLPALSGLDGCGRNSASQLEITGLLFVSLTGPCDPGEAYVRVDGDTGTLVLRQQGTEIVSLEVHRYGGLPVVGHTLTTLRTRFVDGVPLARALAYA